jgi:arylsulfatase A-like enzyme
MGWNALRDMIFAYQKRLGVIPEGTELTEWPDSLGKWETLTSDEKKLFARLAEVFAAYTAYSDHEIGRVIQKIDDMGELDNTLIIYICGDNGTSPEGTLLGTPNPFTAYNGILPRRRPDSALSCHRRNPVEIQGTKATMTRPTTSAAI